MKDDDIVEIAAQPRASLEAADGRRAIIDFGVAFIERHHECSAAPIRSNAGDNRGSYSALRVAGEQI